MPDVLISLTVVITSQCESTYIYQNIKLYTLYRHDVYNFCGLYYSKSWKKTDRAELAFYTETKHAKDMSITRLVMNG